MVDPVAEIKDRLSIDDVVGRYVDLKRSGSTYKGLCPFHQEKTPSFYVTPSRGTFHCFGCGKGGDIFSFVMEMEKLAFPEALQRLAEQAGVSLPEKEARKPSLSGKLYEVNEVAARFFQQALKDQGARARSYLEQRSFDQQAVELFGLGYAPEGREALVQHLYAAGYDNRILLAAGLIVQDEESGRVRDRFRGRLMFPIRDASNRIVGFGGRTLTDAQPKYLNSPQTEIFDKSSVLFGIQRAQDAIRQAKQAVVVEGYLDAIRAHVAGFTNTVASLGTAITVAQLRSLGRLTERVVLALDPDAAGQSAAARTTLTALAELTESKGRATGAAGALDLLIATLPEGHGDPDELIRDAPELWKQTLDAAVDAFDFYFHQTLASLDRSSDRWRQEAIDRLVPVIQRFSSSAAWQAAWLERLATETGVDIQALHRSLPGARPSRRTRTPTVKSEQSKDVVTGTTSRALTGNPVVGVERSLLALLLKVMILPTSTIELLRSLQLREPAHAAIVQALLAWQDTTNYDYEMLREELPEDTREMADGLRALDVPLPEDGKITVAVQYHLARRRQFELQEQLSRATDALSEAATEDRQMAVNNLADLMDQRRTLEQALDHLSRLVVQAASVQGTMDQDSGRL